MLLFFSFYHFKLSTHLEWQPYVHEFIPQAKLHKTSRKGHWGISSNTWWAHVQIRKNEEWGQFDMPIHIRIQDRPMAIPYSHPTQQIKHGFTHNLSHTICKKQATKALKYYNRKPKIKWKWHLLVENEQKCRTMEAKMQKTCLRLLNSKIPWALTFFLQNSFATI